MEWTKKVETTTRQPDGTILVDSVTTYRDEMADVEIRSGYMSGSMDALAERYAKVAADIKRTMTPDSPSGKVASACICGREPRAPWYHAERCPVFQQPANETPSADALEGLYDRDALMNGGPFADASVPTSDIPDPWKHRSKGMKCGTCMWFVVKASENAPADARGALGRCRRHAPTMSGFPAVFESDWCGDHKLDETKL